MICLVTFTVYQYIYRGIMISLVTFYGISIYRDIMRRFVTFYENIHHCCTGFVRFDFFAEWFFNDKAIFVEERRWNYFNQSWGG